MSSLQVAAQAACEQIGVIYQNKPSDGGFHNLDVEGKLPRNGNGRIKLYADGEGGQVWNHVTSETLQFWAKSDKTFTPAEAAERRRRAQEERAQAEVLLAAERAAAAALAVKVWKAATPTANSAYFSRKQVTPTGTVKEIGLSDLVEIIGYNPAAKGKSFESGMVQIIPVSDGAGIATIEMIDTNGLKAGLKNGQKKGCFWSSHQLPKTDTAGLVIGIGEGVATMLTYTMAGGNIGIAALSCGNLASVAKYVRDRYPAAHIQIVSDVGNGEQAAIDAARAVDGYLVKPTFADGSAGTDINDLMIGSGLQGVIDTINAAVAVESTPRPATYVPMFQSFAEMMSEVIEIKELVGSVIQAGCTCQLFGPSSHGKTFIALDIALSVASGGLWNGIQCKRGLVAYFNGEGKPGFKMRSKAWQTHRQEIGPVDFYSSRQVITFDGAGLSLAVSEMRQVEQQSGQKVALIVIDTLARHLIGDENSTKDMSEFVRTVDGMRDKFPDSTALIVHHTGNNAENTGRSRGSSALKAALDVEMQCMNGTLAFTKVKDSEAPKPTDFKLQVVEVGTKPNGEPITSCVVEYGEKSLKDKQSTRAATPQEKTLCSFVADKPGILIGDLRSKFYDRRRVLDPDAKTNTLKNSFLNTYHRLLENKILSEVDNAVFLGGSKVPNVTSVMKASQMTVCDGGASVTSVTLSSKECDVMTVPVTTSIETGEEPETPSHGFVDVDDLPEFDITGGGL